MNVKVHQASEIQTLQDLISKVFYSPTDAQVNCLKNNIKIYIKTAPMCFGVNSYTIIRERITRAY